MPWKNGLGSTAQIAMAPPDALFPGEGFLWRLSAATVETSSPFSQFPGCDRWLVVWQGEGLCLNGDLLPLLKPWSFSGEEIIQCDLVAGRVVDLGLIYRRDRIQADMQVSEVREGTCVMSFSPSVHFLFCVQGELSIHDQVIQVGDCVHLEQEVSVAMEANTGAKFIHVTLRSL